MKETKSIAEKLAEAERAVAEMRQELTKAAGELDRLDTTAGDLDKAVDAQIRLTAKRDILARRLEVASAAVDALRADLLLETEQDLRGQVDEVKSKLDKARQAARAEFQKLTLGGVLEPHQAATLDGMIELHREVAPLISQKEFLDARHREAEAAAADVKRRRAIADGQAAAEMQRAIFDNQ